MDLIMFKSAYEATCLHPINLLLLLAILNLELVSGQSITDTSSIPTPVPPIAVLSTTSTWPAFSNAGLTTSYTSSTSNTTSSVKSRTTDGTPGLFPVANSDSDQPDAETERNQGAFNYYFLILAGFGVVLALALWLIRRRRKRRKEQMRLSGQNALARDLDGWVSTRRWMHGAWRHNQTTGIVRREEGLDEHGEAPPPYQPKSEITVVQDGTSQDIASGLTIPLTTLSREGNGPLRPPGYEERARRGEASSDRPDTVMTSTTHLDTTETRPASSRTLLAEGSVHANG
ncbi:hypothetical protein K491DRAFT_712196 [Lophiostoma macrostomum CBS 122681]|uniref:Uncharacterized protein n=1 Tax=Lophiostoma macrostomum CBS 122681 TaxID=1314788 RepID=A0A6A6TJ37_9PLEO|nr:hypothetical protein K491DRAFT_712196 [Lophiostoma macrostomum CBS 122681]